MLFNSFVFLAFSLVVFALYYSFQAGRLFRVQNLMLLTASYVFYGWWDARFLFLIVISTVLDYTSGLMMDRGKLTVAQRVKPTLWAVLAAALMVTIPWGADPETGFQTIHWDQMWDWNRMGWWVLGGTVAAALVLNLLYPLVAAMSHARQRVFFLVISMVGNLGILGFFKYFNFFTDNLQAMASTVGWHLDPITLNVVLPVGISFYTFQTMSYTIDIYRGHLKATDNFLDFALFVSYFPQLVAGPIERAVNLLPQVQNPRRLDFEQINAGVFLVLLGFFKKVVIADNMALIANQVFNNHTDYTGIDLVIGAVAFTWQIYCDFSGYSDIARGLSKLMGFELMVNFRLPYFALNPSDFWLRWHISLSSWLRDYLYIPLGGNRKGEVGTYRNLSITMLLGGLWHGAAWNFVFWGAYHGLILVIYRLLDRKPEHADPWNGQHSYAKVLFKMALMLVLTIIGWILFRARTVDQVLYFFTHIPDLGAIQLFKEGYLIAYFTLPLIALQIWQYTSRDLLCLAKVRWWWRIWAYSFMLIWMVVFGVREPSEFIYFQF